MTISIPILQIAFGFTVFPFSLLSQSLLANWFDWYYNVLSFSCLILIFNF